MAKFYKLVDGEPVPCGAEEWSSFSNQPERIVAKDHFIDGVHVSTVFLGLDHRIGKGPPLVFETMIFGGEHDGYQERYSTYDEAIAGHAKAVALVKGR